MTLPAGVYEKFWWTILSGSMACFLDLLPAILASVVLLGQAAVFPALAGLLFIVSLDFFCANAGALADLSLPVSVSQGIKSIIQVLFVYIGLLPAIVVIIIGVSFDAVVWALVGVAVAELLLGMVAFAITPQLLKNGRR